MSSPVKSRETYTPSYPHVSDSRTSLMRDVGDSVPEVTLHSMLTALLPAVPDLNDVCKSLLVGQHVNKDGWKFDIHPSASGAHETKAFEKLTDVFNTI